METYANYIFDKFLNCKSEKVIHDLDTCLNIVDGVLVNSRLIYTKLPLSIDLELRPKRIRYVYPENQWDRFEIVKAGPNITVSLEMINYALNVIMNDTIKLNAYEGHFVDSAKKKSIISAGISFFGSKFQENEDCCVCLEKTMTKTNCEHFMCIRCWSKLKKNSCPVCRMEKIYVYDSDEDSSDDDDYVE